MQRPHVHCSVDKLKRCTFGLVTAHPEIDAELTVQEDQVVSAVICNSDLFHGLVVPRHVLAGVCVHDALSRDLAMSASVALQLRPHLSSNGAALVQRSGSVIHFGRISGLAPDGYGPG